MAMVENTLDAVVKGGVVPYLQVDGAMDAARFYERAFGARLIEASPPDDQNRHVNVHVHVNGGSIMLADAFPERGHPLQNPQAFNLMLQVGDAESWWSRAVEAGAEVLSPLQKMFWGATYGQLRDPFGVVWAVNEPGE